MRLPDDWHAAPPYLFGSTCALASHLGPSSAPLPATAPLGLPSLCRAATTTSAFPRSTRNAEWLHHGLRLDVTHLYVYGERCVRRCGWRSARDDLGSGAGCVSTAASATTYAGTSVGVGIALRKQRPWHGPSPEIKRDSSTLKAMLRRWNVQTFREVVPIFSARNQ
ncbi:hypothetical protein BDZ90DRAFT_229286 [Jaminaea rosea]|uniref:Uncharacterized protein n=1 Tax=Jaminaea rosea TaxID=1569628 RepID=A0A316V264_9BASI|nr:hypothetical protein BDZ90DRAFT_229286 [Jaminaea rosea]PWN30273.1 hypothetical protein BDZ90DRAFT_229286 [Jaminaea rosea]